MSENYMPEVLARFQENGIEQMFVKKRDVPDEELLANFGNLCNIIESTAQEGKNILVHCAMGMSRSASVVIAYGKSNLKSHSSKEASSVTCQVMQRWGISRSDAKALVRDKRSIVRPNRGFYTQLRVWEECEYDIHTKWMIDGVKQFKLPYQQWQRGAVEDAEMEEVGKGSLHLCQE